MERLSMPLKLAMYTKIQVNSRWTMRKTNQQIHTTVESIWLLYNSDTYNARKLTPMNARNIWLLLLGLSTNFNRLILLVEFNFMDRPRLPL